MLNASEWVTRRREYGWPDQETISLVVEGGCHIVPVAHIDCNEDEYQWRISFSKAEIILIKRWTPKQQMVYHMLRYFAKNELIPSDWRNFDEIVSTYSLKTLMLWQSERKPLEWWNSRGILETCCRLVRILFSCLMNVDCKNYFIRKCNLFAHRINEGNYDIVLEKLSNFVSDARLIRWFQLNYYLKFIERSRTMTAPEKTIVISPYFDESRYTVIYTFSAIASLNLITQRIVDRSKDPNIKGYLHPSLLSRGYCLKHIGLIEEGVFVDFYKAHIMLQVVTIHKIYPKHDNLFAMLSSLLSKQPQFWENSFLKCQFPIFQIIERKQYYRLAEHVLMGFTTNYETDHFLKMKLAKILIKKELEFSGNYRNKSTNYCVDRKLLHLAAIYYALKRYNQCLEHTLLISDGHAFKQSDCLTWIPGAHLVFIDEIAFVIGLLSLLRRDDDVGKKSDNNDSSWLTSLTFLREWLTCMCRLELFKQRMCVQSFSDIHQTIHFPETVADLCLFMIMQRRIIRDSQTLRIMARLACSDSKSSIANTREVWQVSRTDTFEDLITKCAVTHLTKYQNSLREDTYFKNETGFKAVSHYKALYCFKLGRYDLVLKLCKATVEEEKLSLNPTLEETDSMGRSEICTLCSTFLELFDPEFKSLIGLLMLIDASLWEKMNLEERKEEYSIPILRPCCIAEYLYVQCLFRHNTNKLRLIRALSRLTKYRMDIEKSVTMYLACKINRLIKSEHVLQNRRTL